jgi:hypothetical protein
MSSYFLTSFLFIRIDGRKYSSLRVFLQSFILIFLPALSPLLVVFQYIPNFILLGCPCVCLLHSGALVCVLVLSVLHVTEQLKSFLFQLYQSSTNS